MGRNDRFIGPALCCMRHGILPYYITRCLAYGFCYSRKEEPQSMEIREMVEQQGIEEAVRHFCQLDTEVAEEKTVFDLIVAAYKDISGEDPFGNG